MLEHFTWFKQSAYLWQNDGLAVYIDPWGVSGEVPADVIFITHAHYDHYSPSDIALVKTDETTVVAPHDVAAEISGKVIPVAPGDVVTVSGIRAEAVPAYNNVEARLSFHPRRKRWVGYVLSLGGTDYYHAGDTDHLPELEDVHCGAALLPIGGTYTMDPGQAAGLARSIGPQVAVPMHYGFVVGSSSDAALFKQAAAPVQVEILKPVNPFVYE